LKMNLSLSTKLYLVIGMLTGVIVAGTTTAFFSLSYMVNGYEGLSADDGVQREAAMEGQVQLGLAVQAYKNYLVRKDDKYVQEFKDAVDKIKTQAAKFDKLVADAEEKAAVAKAREALASYEQSMQKLVEACRAGDDIAAVDKALKGVDKPLREAFVSIDEISTKNYEAKAKHLRSVASVLKIFIAFSAMAATVFAVVVGVLIVRTILKSIFAVSEAAGMAAKGDLSHDAAVYSSDEVGHMAENFNLMMRNLRDIVGQIHTVTNTVANSSVELSATVGHITMRVEEQSGRATQVATASTEMSQTVIDIAKNASDIAMSASDTLTTARAGENVVSRTVQEVQEIARTVSESSGLMTSLGNRSRQIGEIVDVIKDIADQTNLLALNAAIEAARAGEQGRGFAVVADEVRKLAERTGKATTEISEMITAIQGETQRAVSGMGESLSKVEAGTSLSREAGEALHKIVDSVNALQAMVQQIASATEEMSTVSEGINMDIEAIASLSKETSSDAGQIAAESRDLTGLASNLKKTTSQFRLA